MAFKNADWLDIKRAVAYPRIFMLVYILVGVAFGTGAMKIASPDGSAFGFDFMNVYAAGVAVHEGRPVDAYDWKGQGERERRIDESLNKNPEVVPDTGAKPYYYLPWLYPPTFLSVGWLFALLPFLAALAAYSAVGFLAYGAVLYKIIAERHKAAIWATAAFPGLYVNLLAGQNGAMTTALLGAGLLFLDKTPIAAGIFFGLLSYKPHLFVLVPLVLFAGRYWKALAATLVSAGVCASLSLAAFGLDSWLAFIQGLGSARSVFLESDGAFRWLGIMHSPFSAVRLLGGSVQAAYAVQTGIAVCVVFILLYIWSRKATSLSIRASALCGVILLASPYSFGYDQVLLALPIAFLAKEGIENGFLSFEKIFLFALWLLPAFAKDGGENYAVPLTPPMLMGLLAFSWLRMKRELSVQK